MGFTLLETLYWKKVVLGFMGFSFLASLLFTDILYNPLIGLLFRLLYEFHCKERVKILILKDRVKWKIVRAGDSLSPFHLLKKFFCSTLFAWALIPQGINQTVQDGKNGMDSLRNHSWPKLPNFTDRPLTWFWLLVIHSRMSPLWGLVSDHLPPNSWTASKI